LNLYAEFDQPLVNSDDFHRHVTDWRIAKLLLGNANHPIANQQSPSSPPSFQQVLLSGLSNTLSPVARPTPISKRVERESSRPAPTPGYCWFHGRVGYIGTQCHCMNKINHPEFTDAQCCAIYPQAIDGVVGAIDIKMMHSGG